MDTEIRVILDWDSSDYICLTDMARFRDNDPAFVIGHWMRNRSTIDYLGLWESINNPDFKPTEFGRFREESANAEMLKQGLDRTKRFQLLQKMAKEQLDTLDKCNAEQRFRKLLPGADIPQLPEK